MVVEPFGFAQDAFLYEPKPLGDSAAFEIADGAMQNDAVTVLCSESVIRKASGGARHDSTTLVRGIQPVAQLGSTVE